MGEGINTEKPQPTADGEMSEAEAQAGGVQVSGKQDSGVQVSGKQDNDVRNGDADIRTENLTSVIAEIFGSGKWNAHSLSALSLAYMGDCVYDLIIRTVLTTHDGGTNGSLHVKAAKIVNAAAQARLIEAIEPDLTDEERAVYHHGRNAKNTSSAKNAKIVDYRKATGLETLVGYLYLDGQYERLNALVKTGLDRTVWEQKN